MTGGKRIAPVDAIYMLEEVDRSGLEREELHIAETDPERFELLQQIAHEF